MAAVKKIENEVNNNEVVKEEIGQEVLDELVQSVGKITMDEGYVLENRTELKDIQTAAKRLRAVFGTATPGPVLELALFLQLESIKKSLELIVEKLDK